MQLGFCWQTTAHAARPRCWLISHISTNTGRIFIGLNPSNTGDRSKKCTRKQGKQPRAARDAKNRSANAIHAGGGPEAVRPTDQLFDKWDAELPAVHDTEPVPVDSLESAIGYESLIRQMHRNFVRSVAFFKSPAGGSLSTEEARAKAFHGCTNDAEAKEKFETLMCLPLDSLNFCDLMELQAFAPRVAEQLWEMAKREGGNEFLSGHLAANTTFPAGYMKEVWNIARYLGVRETFITDWKPSGGLEMSLIDMLAQSYFQWQFWLEETVKRSQTQERKPHREYQRWMEEKAGVARASGDDDGYWTRPTISEAEALDQAVQMADRWNWTFMRTLRQLRDLRRYAPVTINNANQVNIAAEGGNQVNVSD